MNETTTKVVFERTAATKATVIFGQGTELYRFRATSEQSFERQLHGLCRAACPNGYELVEVAT
jgi:hypothetical protein